MTKKRITAAELMASLEKDPKYLAMMQEKEAKRMESVRKLAEAEVAVVADLKAAGIDIDSVWDLGNLGRTYTEALPILLDHLDRPYPDDLREIMARALRRQPGARFSWAKILQMYRDEVGVRAKDGFAATLSELANDQLLDDVIALVRDPKQGPSRVLLLSALAKSKRPDAREVLEEMASDPDLEKEIRFLRKIERRSSCNRWDRVD